MADGNVTDAVGRLLSARRTNHVLTDYPGPVPRTLDDAYGRQADAIMRRGGTVGGWKVGRVPECHVERFGADRMAGPIFADAIVEAGVGNPIMPILDGFAAVEAELLMRIGTNVLRGTSIDDARDAIDAVRFGIEIASSPFVGINDHGPAVTVSDFGNNYGLVLGPVIDDWRTRDLSNAQVTMTIDGDGVGVGCASTMLDGPFGAVLFLIDLLKRRNIAILPGTWISTGAITGVHRATPGQRAVACFDNKETVAVRLAAAPTT